MLTEKEILKPDLYVDRLGTNQRKQKYCNAQILMGCFIWTLSTVSDEFGG